MTATKTKKIAFTIKKLPHWIARFDAFELDIGIKIRNDESDRYYQIYEVKILPPKDIEGLYDSYCGEYDLDSYEEEMSEDKYQKLTEYCQSKAIGTMRIVRYAAYHYEKNAGSLIAYTDGEDENLGRVPLYFADWETRQQQCLGRAEDIKLYKLNNKGEIKPGNLIQGEDPASLIELNYVTQIWHIDNCTIEKDYRGYDLGIKAISRFLKIFALGTDAVSTIPMPPDAKKIDQRAKRDVQKTSSLLRKYWQKLKLNYYSPDQNILWGYVEE